ncbi:MAG: DNA-formamidopyrimidine glycosylase [Firmicutes bacterium]|nr:DNA-formamidopyrimidine glycosylase [Bacillota bacterium]
MPELPEVENVIRSLVKKVSGKIIINIEIVTPNIIYNRMEFKDLVISKTIVTLLRRGKYIIIKLSEGNLLIHLRMTGKLLYNGEVNKHTHLRFKFLDGDYLIYNDVRKFGRVSYLNNDELEVYLNTKVGLEPGLMVFDEFKDKLMKKTGAIKKNLLDQTVIAGIGNIYADEILFASGIHPLFETKNLLESDLENLYNNIREILEEATIAGGSTIRDYVNGEGAAGAYQDTHKVYGKSGKECISCGCKLEKIKVAGRTSVFCPICQRIR